MVRRYKSHLFFIAVPLVPATNLKFRLIFLVESSVVVVLDYAVRFAATDQHSTSGYVPIIIGNEDVMKHTINHTGPVLGNPAWAFVIL